MIFSKTKLLFLTAASAFFLTQVPLAEAAEKLPAIKLTQTHFFMGKAEVTISKKAIRLENISQLKFILVAKAPDWKVTIFRQDDKTYFTESFKEFCDTGLMSDLLIGRNERIPTLGPFRHSTMHTTPLEIERLTGPKITLKYLEIKNLTAPEVELIIYSAYKVPTNMGIPVTYVSRHFGSDFVTGMKQTGKIDTPLDTSKIEKVTVNSDIFILPAGYKKAKSIREVVAGTSARVQGDDANALFDKVK